MSCVVCESYGVQLRPAVDVLVVPYSVEERFKCLNIIFGLLKTIYVHLLVCYLYKLQNARCNGKDNVHVFSRRRYVVNTT